LADDDGAWSLVPQPVRRIGDDLVDLADGLLTNRLRLAVTGLRRSGKTVLITSLVHHLIDGHDLPFLKVAHDGRYRGARLQPGRHGATFPYAAFAEQLSAPRPSWPEATERLSSLRLEIAYTAGSGLWRHLDPATRLYLDVIDYPGEWLLDLPLLERDFARFSAETLQRAVRPIRAVAARAWLARIAALPADAPADPDLAAELAALFTDYLRRCQRELGLSLIQPGRFLSPGEHANSPLLAWSPLPDGPAPPGSLRALMRERYDAYRRQVIEPFWRDHFSRFDRQIVLVDLFSPLNRGPEHLTDTQEALALILECFRYGSGSWWRRLLRPRIDKLLFAASKADHVAPSQHPALKQLLERLTAPAARGPRFEGVPYEVMALAALRCTDVVKTVHEGQVLSCVRGRLKDEERETVLFPGEVPAELPDAEDWTSGRFRFREFAPRRLVPGGVGQHLRLDQALEYLLGDHLR
jgi:predicted YcjX-like family ATPase